jgi:3',5'-cyclic AMP phosphodiesterase CpdA
VRHLTLLQIGDIHLDAADREGAYAVVGDKGFPQTLIEEIGPVRLRAVIKAILRAVDKRVDGMVFCGDLTSHGEINVYRACVRYLEQSFEFTAGTTWKPSAVHVVPGNHDVDRDLTDASDRNAKFGPYAQAWTDLSIPVLEPARARITLVGDEGAQASLISLNSCLGCGEERDLRLHFPEEERTRLEQLVENGDRQEKAEAKAALWEAMDTPMFANDDLDATSIAIEEMDRAIVPVIVAHHNLLPQALPRVKLYTEMVNAGPARSRFAGLGVRVLYLHGHIHRDPIEIIDQLHPSPGSVVSISAPLLSDGFNHIELQFADDGLPLGCVVTPVRYHEDGRVQPGEPVRVPMRRKTDLAGDLVPLLLSNLVPRRLERFRDIKFDEIAPGVSSERIRQALLEAEWAGWIHIDQRDEPCDRWRLELLGP